MLAGLVHSFASWLQKCTAVTSYAWAARKHVELRNSWVVGPEEIANMVSSIARGIPGSYSLVRGRHNFYSAVYDSQGPSERAPWIFKCVVEAWQFGQLAASSKGFMYVGPAGFLRAIDDSRRFEFRFLKERARGVACYFTGSDIRSVRVMRQREQETGVPNIATYLPALNAVFDTESYDQQRRELAESADQYADVIFTAARDQEGYLTSATQAFRYFFPAASVVESFEKYSSEDRLVVVHAPSSPIIKGTPLVRAAVTEMRAEGFDFEYVELNGVPHSEVALQLARAHIVLNEFYASMPGVFGVEAMAAGAVLLTSAAEEDEPQLPEGSDQAWIVTRHHEVAAKMRQALMSSREELAAQAERGRNWVRDHATEEVSGPIVSGLLVEAIPGARQ